MPNFRILIVDDHEIVRQGLRSMLDESHPGWEVCGEATDGWEALKQVEQLNPDMVLLDIGMPNMNGLDSAREILSANSKMRILFLTLYETEQAIKTAMQLGAKGLVLKSEASRELVGAVEAIQQNSSYFGSRVKHAASYTRAGKKSTLTRRETEVVQLLAQGKSTKEVAAQLDLSVKTAETHRSNIMRKLGLHSISELILYAVRNNLIQAPDSASPSLQIPKPPSTPKL